MRSFAFGRRSPKGREGQPGNVKADAAAKFSDKICGGSRGKSAVKKRKSSSGVVFERNHGDYAAGKRQNTVQYFVDGRFYCGLTLEAAVKNRLKAGQTIDPDRLGEIQLESERSTALDKALHFIAASQKTERQIREYLAGKGYLAAVSDYVLEKMSEYGFLDDRQYAENYAALAVKKKGARLIRAELREKEFRTSISETRSTAWKEKRKRRQNCSENTCAGKKQTGRPCIRRSGI